MITDRMKSIIQGYIVGENTLTESEKKEVTSKFVIWETLFSFDESEKEVDIIQKGVGHVGKSYDGVNIKWY